MKVIPMTAISLLAGLCSGALKSQFLVGVAGAKLGPEV